MTVEYEEVKEEPEGYAQTDENPKPLNVEAVQVEEKGEDPPADEPVVKE